MSNVSTTRHEVPFADLVKLISFVGQTIFDTATEFTRAAAHAFEAVEKHVKVRKTINEVSSLSDDVLNDIGLDRSEIEPLARRAVENHTVDYRVLRSW